MSSTAVARAERPASLFRPSALIGFALVHVAALGVFAFGFSWKLVALCLASYYLRMFAITAGFHRYFSHRTFQLARLPQFLLAFLGQTSAQKGVLWWSAHHRHHHRFSDQPEDLHSPVQRGFWWSHMGWILADEYQKTNLDAVPDLAKFPELRWLDRNQYLPTVLYAVAIWLAFSWEGLFWGYFLSTVLLWHGTFTINSLTHVVGRRVFRTKDDSRNNWICAILTMGEGWHNNHHYYPGSASQGFRWWEVDASFYLLWIGERLGLVNGLHRPPERLRSSASPERITPADRAAVQRWRAEAQAAFDAAGDRLHERIEKLSASWASARSAALHAAHQALADLESARLRAAERLETLHEEYAAARAAFAEANRDRRRRAVALAERRLAELRAEIEGTRQHLAEVLERLVAHADALALPA